jgi:spore germination protein GerM
MTKKRLITGGIAAFVLVIGLTGLFLFLNRDSGAFRLPVYSYNPNTFRLDAIEHSMPAGDINTWLEAALTLFANSSRIPAHTGVWLDEEGFLADWGMHGDILEAEFRRPYYEIPPLEEALFRAAFVWTMTGLPFVNHVRIVVEGDDRTEILPMLENRQTVEINPAISSVRLITRTFTLYFLNENHDALVPVEHFSTTVDMDQVERYIVALLINGPVYDNVIGIIPQETKIVNIVTEENICYVNLSGDFVSRFSGGTDLARLMVYSVVNSLTDNLVNVRRVQFLIDSERLDQLHGMTDFHQAFEWDETLLEGYME